MKNLNNFNEFKNYKKINEVSDARAGSYGGGGDTYFANVKGNFAGAENTLVGSGVIKLFNFLKRKGQQSLLWLRYRPMLYSIYAKGLLRYIIRNNMHLPSPKTEVNAIYKGETKESNNNEEITLKINLKKEDNKYKQLSIGNEILDKDNNKVKDGFYIILNNMVEIENSVIKNVEDYIENVNIPIKDDTSDDQEDAPIEQESGEKSDKQEKEDTIDKSEKNDRELIDYDLNNYLKQLKDDFLKLDDVDKTSFAYKNNREFKILINSFNKGIVEIDNILNNDNISESEKQKLSNDKIISQNCIKGLEDVVTFFNNEISKLNKKPPTKKNKPNVGSVSKPKKVFNFKESHYNDSLDFLYEFKKPEVSAKSSSKRLGDELNILSQVNIDWDDQDFAKQFDNPSIKKAATDVVLESKPEILFVQEAAERMFLRDDGKIDRKLENNWRKMVDKVKSNFTRFLDTDRIDPIVIGKSDRGKIDIGKESSGVKNIPGKREEDELIKANKITSNKKLKGILSLKEFSAQGTQSYGITSYNGYYFTYFKDEFIYKGGKYFTYRVINGLKNDFMDVKPEESLEDYVLEIPESFKPKEKTRTINNVRFTHKYTFIISISKGKNISAGGTNKTSMAILYVYNKDGSPNTNITKDNYNDSFEYYYKLNNGNEERIIVKNAVDNDKESKISAYITNPYEILKSEINQFKISDNASNIRLKEWAEQKDSNFSLYQILPKE